MIDPKKQYRTRDGREVRIYAVDGSDDYPVHGAFLSNHGWKLESWDLNGYWTDPDHEDNVDLIEVKPRIKRDIWVNVYEGADCWAIHTCKEDADRGAMRSRLACVKLTIDCEKGEGL